MTEEMESTLNSKTVMVTGGAGFVGSHLVDRLMNMGAKVTVVDNLVTGSRENLNQALQNATCKLIKADASEDVSVYTDENFHYIFHLASPASPVDFEKTPKEIYKVNAYGTEHLCEFASTIGARLLFASTSEAYGDPLEHPQKETYFGNVNPIGPRTSYDESKRFGEMVVSTFTKQDNLDARTVRIFNTYGPRMRENGGRVIPTFVSQALGGNDITVHGNGSQTRSFCYVDDLVEYLLQVMISDKCRGEVVNLGNPDEYSMQEVAEKVKQIAGSESDIVNIDPRDEDPARRQPDISKVVELVGYEPKIGFEEGLGKIIDWAKNR